MPTGRWVVEVDLDGEAGEPRVHTGSARSGARTIVTAFGTEWQGVGPTPAAALDYAHRARSDVLPHVDEVVRSLEHALGRLTQGGEGAVPRPLMEDVERLLGLARIPPVVTEWTLRAWLVELRRALRAPW
jgi:hypothetical protein